MFARAIAVIGLNQGFPGGDAALSWIARVAVLARLTPQRRAEIVSWLAPLEHIVRKLLLAEAAALHRAERAAAARVPRLEHIPLRGLAQHAKFGIASPQARLPQQTPIQCEAEGSRNDLDFSRPETWRAHFSLAIPRDPRRVAQSNAPRIRALWGGEKRSETPKPAPRPDGNRDTRACHALAFRLARRFEALRRVLENPRLYAERLARVLSREIVRRSDVVRAYLFAPCRANGHDPADPRLGLDAIGEAFGAELAFNSS